MIAKATKKRKRLKIILFVVVCSLVFVYVWLRLTAGPVAHHPFYINKGNLETIAHRGGAGERPENTLEAMDHAASSGVDILEFDIRRTEDDQLVLLHDKTLDRTTNCQGLVSEKKLVDLLHCDAGFWFNSGSDEKNEPSQISGPKERQYSFRGKGIQIPTLDSVFDQYPGFRMIIEIKPSDPEINPIFCGLIRKYQMQSKVLVGSFHQEILDDFRNRCPDVTTSTGPGEVVRFFLFSKIGLPELYTPAATALQIPPRLKLPFGWFPFLEVITPQLIKNAHLKNMVVQAWTINESKQMQDLNKMGIDGIMTDLPTALVRTLAGPAAGQNPESVENK